MFEKKVGTAAEVWHGKAEMTPGGVKKSGFFLDEKDGRIKSKAQSEAAKKNPGLVKWRKAVDKAKKQLKIPSGEFALIKGKLLTKTKKIFAKESK
jgi:hypothetical protein